jgi:inner membrane protein
MDSLTHALTGAVIAKAVGDEKIGNWGVLAGTAMGFFPDVDFVLGLINHHFYLQYHRDFTHSLILAPFYALFFSWVFVKLSKRPSLGSFYKICFPALLSHILLDLITSYGTMIFSPFFEHRYSWDLVYIVDLILSAILLFPLIGSFFAKRKAQWICRGSLAGLAVYLLFCWTQHHQAVRLADAFAANLGEEVVKVASIPQPLSPFRWGNFIKTREKVYRGFVDLRIKESSSAPLKHPLSFFFPILGKLEGSYHSPREIRYQSWERAPSSPWVKKALNTDGVKFYYWFARFPVAKPVDSSDGRHRIEFMDMRFGSPGIRQPFIYYVEMDDSGRVRSEGFL